MRSNPPNSGRSSGTRTTQRNAGVTEVKRPQFTPADFVPSGPPIEVKHVPIRPLDKAEIKAKANKKNDK